MLIYSPWEIFLLSYLAGTVLTAASDCCVLSFHHESLGRIFLCLCRRVKTKIKFFPWLSSLYANQTMFFQPWASAAPSNYPSWSFSLGWTHSSFPVPFIYVGHISRCRLTGGKCSSSSTTATPACSNWNFTALKTKWPSDFYHNKSLLPHHIHQNNKACNFEILKIVGMDDCISFVTHNR